MPADAAEKQARILPLFEYATLTTKDKFNLRVQRDHKLDGLGILGRGQLFNCFHEKHVEEATRLYELFLQAETFDEFLDLAHMARDLVNEGLYIYALSVAIVHRPDCRGIALPSIEEIFPEKFVPAQDLHEAYWESSNVPEDEDVTVDISKTGNILDPEYKLAYYREDIGVNVHHWHWHVVYPALWRPEIIGKLKNRKGELFYYMHQQMCARYDCERLCNDLPQMIPFHNFHEPMEGYASHLIPFCNYLPYSSRPNGAVLHDSDGVSVQDLERWRDRILDSIHTEHVHDSSGNDIPLDEEHGIDILGDLFESSYQSVNRNYYGSLHNWGHVLMSAVQDPDHKFQSNPGVMSDTATSLRDPIFYRWHRFMDNIFQEHKKTLPHYGRVELGFTGVDVENVTVMAEKANVIDTFFAKDVLNISHGIYLGRSGSLSVQYTHLDHRPFSYKIEVNNHGNKTRHATVRIFLAPKFDELGNKIHADDLRHLMIELDKFHIELFPGHNEIKRKSDESSVTIDSKKYTLLDMKEGKGASDHAGTEYCSCGWPQHLLVPKGKEEGMKFHLFVMLSDWLKDVVWDHGKTGLCTDAVSYCGAKDQLYPDKRAMGFPFDRVIDEDYLEEWMMPNMHETEVTIMHHGEENEHH